MINIGIYNNFMMLHNRLAQPFPQEKLPSTTAKIRFGNSSVVQLTYIRNKHLYALLQQTLG